MKSFPKPEIAITAIVFGVLLILGFNSHTTGDAGDSVMHYLYSHYSFKYPQFFLHHWAKPLFVLLSSPFSQFGFIGMIIFNSLCASITALLTYYSAKNLNIKNPFLVYIFIFFSPLFFKLIFSGLTEYLFALFLILGIFLTIKKKYIFSLVVVSFLPLIRSEGLLILGLFGFYYLINKKYKHLLILGTGQLFYSIVGAFYYKDILWVFNKIPYANMGSPYGKGELLDFVHRLNYVIEKPIYLLLAIGGAVLVFSFIKSYTKTENVKLYLVFGSFLALFIGHTIFWWQGIFNSMGLPRVLNAVIPVIAIVAAIGVEFLTDRIKHSTIKNIAIAAIIIIVISFPFTNRPEGVVFNETLYNVEENNLIDEEVVPYLHRTITTESSPPLYFTHPYISLTLGVDYFDDSERRELKRVNDSQLESNSLVVWDEWFSVVEEGVTFADVSNSDQLELLEVFERKENERLIKFAVFKVK